jgi:hypothetical protein
LRNAFAAFFLKIALLRLVSGQRNMVQKNF